MISFEQSKEGITDGVTVIPFEISTGVVRVAAVALSRHRSREIDRDMRRLKQMMESGEL